MTTFTPEQMDLAHEEALRGGANGAGLPYRRDRYQALTQLPADLQVLLDELDGIAWTTGIVSDSKRRGRSINVAAYSIDHRRGLAVVQVRQCQFRPGRFNRVRKDYYLVGRNENGNPFAHPIEFRAAGKVVRDDAPVEAGVRLALTRIWACAEDELNKIVRNGDVAFVPDVLPVDAQPVDGNAMTLRESHHVQAVDGQLYRVGDTYYVRGRARIEHAKRQHPTARVRGGVWRVQVGIRGSVWGFTAPTAD